MAKGSLQRLIRVASRKYSIANNLASRNQLIIARQLSTENPSRHKITQNESLDGGKSMTANSIINKDVKETEEGVRLNPDSSRGIAMDGSINKNVQETEECVKSNVTSESEAALAATGSATSENIDETGSNSPVTTSEVTDVSYKDESADFEKQMYSTDQLQANSGLQAGKILDESSVDPTTWAKGASKEDVEEMRALYAELKYINRHYGMYQVFERYKQASKTHPVFSAEIYSLVIPTMTKLKFLHHAKEALGTAHKNGVRLRTEQYNAILYAYMRKGFSFDIRELIDFMWTVGPEQRPNASSYNKLIGALFYGRQVQEAFTLLDEMKEKRITPTLSTYLTLIFGCVQASEPRRGYEVFQTLEKSGAEVPTTSIAHLLVACARDGDVEAVSNLMNKYEQALPKYKMTLQRLLKGEHSGLHSESFSATADFDGPWKYDPPRLELSAFDPILQTAYDASDATLGNRAWALLRDSYDVDDIPARLWYKVVGANGRAGDFARAFQLIAEYEQTYGSNMRLNHLMGAVVEPLAKDLTAVDRVYYSFRDKLDPPAAAEEQRKPTSGGEDISGAAVAPDATVTSETEAASKAKAASKSEATSDAETASKADSAVRLGDTEAEIGTERVSSNISDDPMDTTNSIRASESSLPEPSATALNCLIAACAKARDTDRTFQTFDDIVNVFDLKRNTDSYNALLLALLGRSQENSVYKVVKDMEMSNVEVDQETIRLIMQSNISIGRSVQAMKWIKYSKQKNIPVSIRVYQNLLASFVKFPEVPVGKIEEVIQYGLEDGYVMSSMMPKLKREDRNFVWAIKKEVEKRADTAVFESEGQGSEKTFHRAEDSMSQSLDTSNDGIPHPQEFADDEGLEGQYDIQESNGDEAETNGGEEPLGSAESNKSDEGSSSVGSNGNVEGGGGVRSNGNVGGNDSTGVH